MGPREFPLVSNFYETIPSRGFSGSSVVKNLPAVQEPQETQF